MSPPSRVVATARHGDPAASGRRAPTLRGPASLVVAVVAALAGASGAALASPFVVTPSGYLSEQYNDNVFFSDDPQDDFITSIGAGLSMQYRSPRLSLWLSGGTSAQIYALHSSQNNAGDNVSGTLAASYQATPLLALMLSNSLSRVGSTRTGSVSPSNEAPPPDVEPPGPATDASTLLPRGDAFANFFTAGASYTFYPRWSASLNYSNSVSDFTNPGGQEVTNTAAVSLGYAWSPVLALNTSFAYQRLSGLEGPDTNSYNPSIGMSYQYDPTWSVSANAGLYVNQQAGDGSDSASTDTGPTFGLFVNKQFALSQVGLGVSQSITTSAGIAGTSLTRDVYLYYNVLLASQLSGSLYTSYSTFNTSPTNFDILSVQASLSYPFWRYFSTGVSYNYNYSFANQTTSTITQGSIDQNLVQVFVSAAYPVWRGDL